MLPPDSLTLDLQGITTKVALHALLKQALQFPEWYGPSWDAFWDCIIAIVSLPTELRLLHWQAFAEASPHDMAILRRIAHDYAQAEPGKRIVFG